MATAGVVSGSVTLSVAFQEYITSGYVNPQTLTAALSALGLAAGTLQLNNGTGAQQVDTLYCKVLTLVASTPQTVNFQSTTDPDSASITFLRGRLFAVFNPTLTAGYDCKIYQAGSNPLVWVPPSSSPGWARANGGLYFQMDPQSTGAGNGNVITSSSCEVTFDPGTNNVTVYVLMVGGSAA
jgi:hypothetical protein